MKETRTLTQESNESKINRRRFLTIGAAGAGTLATASLVEPASAGEILLPDDTPSLGSAPAKITAKPLNPKVYQTAAAGISRKTHDTHYGLYTGYVNKVNEIRGKLAALGVPDPTKGNQTFSEIRELKVEYTFALGGVKNHELYF